MQDRRYTPGLTVASLAACVFALLLMGMLVQVSEIIVSIAFPAEHALALPAIWTFLVVSVICGLAYLVGRTKLLTRAQLLCVMFTMLLSAPLMTQGFWHRIVSVLATNPRGADFEKLDAMNDRLWPHGPNLLAGAFDAERRGSLVAVGRQTWETLEYDQDERAELPVLENDAADQVSSIRLRLPVGDGDDGSVILGEPYILSVMIRPTKLGPEAGYFIRTFADDEDKNYSEVYQHRDETKPTFLHRTGFKRVGAYAVKFPAKARESVTVEFGLKGEGRLELALPKLLSVGVLEGIYKGKLIVNESDLEKKDKDGNLLFPAADRASLIVKPDHMLSLKGLGFMLSGYIPVRDWVEPMLAWTLFVGLLLTATLAIALLMRRQWMDNERFQLPMTRVPLALMDDENQPGAMPAIWKNRLMWTGLALALAYTLARAAHFYYPSFPKVPYSLAINEYLSDPSWGNTWYNARLQVHPIFLALCSFMELGVLFSLVAGYFLFRAQGWIGQLTGWNTDPNYPYGGQQAIGAFITYGLLTLILARKYLWFVLRAAVTGDKAASAGEIVSYRTSLSLLVVSFLGAAAWGQWMGISTTGVMAYFGFLVLVGLVSAKMRAEAGTPWGYFVPYNMAIFMTLLGGVRAFGPEAMIFCYIASFFLASTPFYLIPGGQVELLELGKRWNVNPRHLMATAFLAIVGGMIVGGWVFLSNSYAWGGDTMKYGWAYQTKSWYFFSFNQQLTEATNAVLGGGPAPEADTGSAIKPEYYAYGFAVVGTLVVTLLRQMYSGFFFHPIGFLVGPTIVFGFIEYIWGSCLAAWAIRGVAVWLGGADFIRRKLQPFFVGVFVGAILAELLIGGYATYLRTQGIDKVFQSLTP